MSLMRFLGRFHRDPGPLPPTDSPDVRILIQSMGGIGNTLMATPLIAETRRLFPRARIDVLTSPAAAELLKNDPDITHVLTDRGTGSESVSLSCRIRAARYDAAIVALNSHLSKFALRIVLGGVRRRLMHAYPFKPYDDFSSAYTHVLPRPDERHDVECNLDLLRCLTGADCVAGPLRLHLPNSAKDEARAHLSAFGWNADRSSVALCPGSTGWMHFKRWPLTHAMALADRLVNDAGDRHVVVFCGPDEADDAQAWRARDAHDRLHIVDNLPLSVYAAALSLMSAIVANDSLPMHLAAALQTPVVTLFGPTDPVRTGPWRCRAEIIQAEGAPYYALPYPYDPAQFPDLMATIPPERVYDAVERLVR